MRIRRVLKGAAWTAGMVLLLLAIAGVTRSGPFRRPSLRLLPATGGQISQINSGWLSGVTRLQNVTPAFAVQLLHLDETRRQLGLELLSDSRVSDMVLETPFPFTREAAREVCRREFEKRYGCTWRVEDVTTDVYCLKVSAGGPTSALRKLSSRGSSGGYKAGFVTQNSGTLDDFAALLEAGGVGRPVLNETGLHHKGGYAALLRWEPGVAGSLERAIQTGLGLELHPERRPLRTLVVRRIGDAD